jgi:hypothetical protein
LRSRTELITHDPSTPVHPDTLLDIHEFSHVDGTLWIRVLEVHMPSRFVRSNGNSSEINLAQHSAYGVVQRWRVAMLSALAHRIDNGDIPSVSEMDEGARLFGIGFDVKGGP